MSRLLFLCTGNSSQSQMAKGFAMEIASDNVRKPHRRQRLSVEIVSAGLKAKGLHPKVIEVMAEVGIDISNQIPKTLADIDPLTFDVTIALCNHARKAHRRQRLSARENCLVLLGSLGFVHWELPDPGEIKGIEEEVLSRFREVRDEIHHRVRNFFADGYLSVLVAQRHNIELILENLNDGIIAHDNHRYIFYFNRAAETLTGYRREEVFARLTNARSGLMVGARLLQCVPGWVLWRQMFFP